MKPVTDPRAKECIVPFCDKHMLIVHAGVIGVAVTGVMLDSAGVESIGGWWQAFSTASALCIAGSLYFLSAARGDRIFGDSDQF